MRVAVRGPRTRREDIEDASDSAPPHGRHNHLSSLGLRSRVVVVLPSHAVMTFAYGYEPAPPSNIYRGCIRPRGARLFPTTLTKAL